VAGFLSEQFGFPLSLSFHQCYELVFLSVTDAVLEINDILKGQNIIGFINPLATKFSFKF
jgi:hypothetical protein